ncbi:MAG: transcription-repair coupling factor [Alphaproteobacteria bacterium]|nr:transcription-repair coupling factor [Alphaproteobacteria bacterium]
MFFPSFQPDRPCRIRLGGVPAGYEARLLAAMAHRCKGGVLVHVALDDRAAATLAQALAFFAPEVELLAFPAWDCLPYDRIAPHADICGQRLATLERLLRPFTKPAILFTTVHAFAQKTLPPEVLKEAFMTLTTGMTLPVERLTRFLVARGYHPAPTVREVGSFAVRGGIVDLFPAGFERPVRLDFFDDDIESMRLFDPLTQLSGETLDALRLDPPSEVILDAQTITSFRERYRALFGVAGDKDPLYEAVSAGQAFPGLEHWLPLFYPRLVSLLDYAPSAPVSFESLALESLAQRHQQVEDFYKARHAMMQASKRGANVIPYKPVPVESLYESPETVEARLKERSVVVFSPFKEGTTDESGARGRDFSDARAQDQTALYAALGAYAARHQAGGRRVMITCYSQGSADRMEKLLRAHNVPVAILSPDKSWADGHKLDKKLILLVVLGLEHGFTSQDLAVISEQDILGDRMIRRPRRRKSAEAFQLELDRLNPGDFVVHAEHGIGRYEGLETIEALGAAHDCIRLIYDGGDKLFVPVENMDVLSRYASAQTGAVLDRLGGAAWQARKAQVKKKLLSIADDLLKIAALRALKKAEIIEVRQQSYQEFAARFPYNETEDQEQSIEAVLGDLASGRPMDRLICGDVGFGKTEVALRAAFAAQQAGLQVALIAPTTLLARQHYQSFSDRFSGFGVRIAQLSRMVTAKEAKQTKEDLKEGRVDIVIGTHALLAKDVGFQRLGLVIVDEEQRFGVKQKEQLKELRADAHILTLTATPIPRTLQLALTGVRELSLIASPPVDRLAVNTFVLPYDPLIIRQALMREYYRGGQSFYVCPRIEELSALAEELKTLVPELKIVMAHGRMSAAMLDDIMTGFDARQFDILLVTNIIESGLDIPNANTIILHRADMFGLAQLYQLRGRVGRAKQRGYAYFTYAQNAPLAATAQQRLEVITTLDELGAGFQLASHDMDIRGAGNLLGQEQSGHIREVGIELYQQMLQEAVMLAKAGQGQDEESFVQQDDWTPQINIGLSVLIPETYVEDLGVRLGLYRRLASGAGQEDTQSIAAEMIDRFGPLPQEVENLLRTVEIKRLCRACLISKLDAGPRGAVIGFYQDRFPQPEKLMNWILAQAGTAKVRPDQRLVLMRVWDNMETRLEGIEKTLKELAAMAG